MNIRRRTFLKGATALPLAGVSKATSLQLTQEERQDIAQILDDHLEDLKDKYAAEDPECIIHVYNLIQKVDPE